MIDRHIAKLRPCELGLGLRLGLSGGASFNPAILFANGEQGVWFDRSDLSTMFQDSAGTTACAAGSPVGLALDKSKGLAVGAELVTNGTFDSNTAGWTAGNLASLSVSSNRLRVTNNGSGAGYAYQAVATVIGRWYRVHVAAYLGNGGANSVRFRVGTSTGGAENYESGSLSAGTDTNFYFMATATTSYISLFCNSGTTTGVYTDYDNISVKHIAGNHQYQSTAASRPILRQSGSLFSLEYDGVDDFLVTNAIDFSASDKITVWAGVRKLNSTGNNAVLELSPNLNSNNGAINLFAPLGGSNDYTTESRGTSATSVAVTGYTAPVTNVVAISSDISGPFLKLRLNGAQVGQSTTTQGTGNYGNYAIYDGRRGGTSLPFNGHCYGKIIRGGASDAAMINLVEAWLNAKTGAY